MVNSSVAVTGATGNRARTTSDATTATFPIKRIVIDGQAQQKQPPQRQQTKKGKRPHQHHNDQNQHQQHQQQQQQQEPIDQARIEEAKKAAKLTAKLASRGIILSNHPNTGTSNPQKRNTVMPYLPNIPPVRGPPPIKKLRKTMKVNTKMKKKESKINDDKYQMQQNKPKTKRPATIQEEKREEKGFDDDMSISFTSRTITTAPTNATTDNATSVVHWNVTTDGGTDANPSHKTFFPLSPKRMFQPKRQQQKEMQEFDQYQLNQQQMQLAQQQQKQKELREAQALLNSGAWTCGVCGKPFASLHDAESHELLCLVLWVKHDRRKSSKPQQQQHHIQQQYQNDVPQKQSVNKATKPAPSPTNSIATMPTISSNAGHTIKRFFREKTMSMDDTLTSHNKSQNADDPLSHSQMLAVTPTINLVSPFVSVTAAASAVAPRGKDIIGTCEDGQEQIQSRKLSWSTMSPTPLSYQPPHTRGEIALPSPTIQKYIVLTDDTAVKIARRARNVLFALCRQELFSYSNKNQHKNNNVSSSITSIQSATSIPLSSTDNTTPSSKSSNNDSASLLLLYQEFDAQRELALLSRDRQYYSMLQQHSMGRQHEGQSNQYNYYYYHQYARMGILGDICSIKCEDDDDSGLLPVRIWKTVKYKFEHAYELIKEGPASRSCEDQYKESQDMSGKSGKSSGINSGMEMTHDRHTLYVNVVVKNSVQVVNNELQRMARGWWESTATTNGGTAGGRNKEERKGADTNEGKNVTTHKPTKDEILDFQFEWIRAHTQQKVIQLAGLALASDFTPRKVAIQLSNDLLRLMAPQLELRGVTIHTEIEYRAGPYFVLAVNVLEIDWILLMDHTRKMLVRQRRKWTRDQRIRKERSSTHVRSGADGSKKKKKKKLEHYLVSIRYHFPSRNEIVGQILAFMNRLHFIFAIPLLHIFYSIPFVSYAVNKFILTVVTDGMCGRCDFVLIFSYLTIIISFN